MSQHTSTFTGRGDNCPASCIEFRDLEQLALERKDIALLEEQERLRRCMDDSGEATKQKLARQVSLIVQKTNKPGFLQHLESVCYYIGCGVSFALDAPVVIAAKVANYAWILRNKKIKIAWALEKKAAPVLHSLGLDGTTFSWADVEMLENAERKARVKYDQSHSDRILLASEVSGMIDGVSRDTRFMSEDRPSKRQLTRTLQELERERRLREVSDGDRTSITNAGKVADIVLAQRVRHLHKFAVAGGQRETSPAHDAEMILPRIIDGAVTYRKVPLVEVIDAKVKQRPALQRTLRLYRGLGTPEVKPASTQTATETVLAPVQEEISLLEKTSSARANRPPFITTGNATM